MKKKKLYYFFIILLINFYFLNFTLKLKINGVRIVDKVKNNTKRIEVWLSEDVTKDIGLEKSVRSEIIDIFEISNISENKIAKSFVSFHSAN